MSSNSLSEEQIIEFYHEIDKDGKGFVTLEQLIDLLGEVIKEAFPASNPSQRLTNKLPPHADDIENSASLNGLQSFVRELFPASQSKISKSDFVAHVREWNVRNPSLIASPEPLPPILDRLRARWEVEGPRFAFLTFIVSLQVAFGLWQLIKYIRSPLDRSAFGWGVVMSKTAAGAIYPTFFFLLLSMSRYFATLIRRFKYIPRIINWDRSQSTHVWLAVAGLGLSTLHAIGYLAGSFVHGSELAHQPAVHKVFAPRTAPRTYPQFLRQLPGWSGLTALGLYWIIAILSIPRVRNWSWEVFQLGHILMFPMIGLLCAHGTLAILQRPMLGYWLAFPTLLVALERSSRVAHGCRRVNARLEVLDEHTVTISFEHPRGNWWNYEAGQYVFLQVPAISHLQWHPFTVSSCNGKVVQVHISGAGDWTNHLRSLPAGEFIRIGVDGPFGAPSQRFYEFDRAIVFGAGVGITPFSAIMTDLEQKIANGMDPWAHVKHDDGVTRNEEDEIDTDRLPTSLVTPRGSILLRERGSSRARRRVDFHWIVREKDDLLWFATLLNRAHDLSLVLPPTSLLLKIHTYITNRHKDLSAYIFRYLLDSYRSPSTPYSPLTGLKMRSQLGRPNVEALLLEYHNEMKQEGWNGGRVGVFFCGSSSIGRLLAEACTKLNSTARKDGSKTKYIFMMEVFG